MRSIYKWCVILLAIYIGERAAKKFEIIPINPTDWSSLKSFIHEFDPFPLYSSLYQQWIPKHFMPNFTDLAYVRGSKPPANASLATIIKYAIANLAKLTHTKKECYQALPANITNIPGMMGKWYITAKLGIGLDKSDSSQVENALCEEVVYTQTGQYTFDKVANDHYKSKWMTISGKGQFITPGVILIHWKLLNDTSVTNDLVYTILGTDYTSWVVGYDCSKGVSKPEIVIQTRQKVPSPGVIAAALGVVTHLDLPKKYVVCAPGV